jgi:hypothetical protein
MRGRCGIHAFSNNAYSMQPAHAQHYYEGGRQHDRLRQPQSLEKDRFPLCCHAGAPQASAHQVALGAAFVAVVQQYHVAWHSLRVG